jgi:hypothetical protein
VLNICTRRSACLACPCACVFFTMCLYQAKMAALDYITSPSDKQRLQVGVTPSPDLYIFLSYFCVRVIHFQMLGDSLKASKTTTPSLITGWIAKSLSSSALLSPSLSSSSSSLSSPVAHLTEVDLLRQQLAAVQMDRDALQSERDNLSQRSIEAITRVCSRV